MNIKFYSFIDGQKVFIEGQASKYDDFWGFKDSDNEGYIYFKIENNICYFKRKGKAVMDLIFDPENNTVGHYQNYLGLDFNLVVKTKRLEITKDKIIVEYDYYVDTEYQQTVKLYLIMENALEKA